MKQLYWDIYVRIWSKIRAMFDITYLGSRLVRLYDEYQDEDVAVLNHQDAKNFFRSGYTWGRFHPKSPHQWWGGQEVTLDLYSEPHFKRFGDVLVPFRADVLESKESFGYGFYSLLVDLYPSEWDWMAFWLMSEDGKAEIDVFEFYTDPLLDKEHFDTTLHWGGNYGTSEANRTKAIPSHLSRWQRKPAEFDLLWTRDTIEIYYNGSLARKIVDEKILSNFWGKKMKVIVNCGVQPEKAQFMSRTESGMSIVSFTYSGQINRL